MTSGRRRLGWLVALVLSAAAPVLARQVTRQGPPPATITPPQATTPASTEPLPQGAVSGVVIDGSTGEPVSGVLVYLSTGDLSRPAPGSQTRQMTDEKGRFAFVNIAGSSAYTISASKFGYLDGGYGRDKGPADPLRPVALRADEWISNLRISIWKPGSIGGIVRDESGEPVVGVFVRTLARFRLQGRDDVAAGPIAVTDDRGEYRLSGLAPGRYFVQVPSVQASVPAATKIPVSPTGGPDGVLDLDESHRLVIGRYPLPPPPIDGRPMAYGIVFHPSSPTLAQATAIDLTFGDNRPNIDLTMTPVPAVRVSGIVEGPPEALGALTLRLLPAGLENLGLGAEAATALVGADGRFMFLNVPAGSYTIDAPVKVSELSTTAPGLWGPAFPMPPPAQGWGRNAENIELIPGLTLNNTSFRGGTPAEFSGRTPITVAGGDVTGVVVRLRPHATMTGRIVVEADPAQPAMKPPARFQVALDAASAEAYLGRPQRSFQTEGPPEQFTITGIVPGLYWLRPLGSPAWLVKSITWKGRDYTTVPFDAAATEDLSGVVVTMTNAVPELSGAVRGSEDLKADASMVIAFPVNPASWRNIGFWPARLKATTVSSTGTYRFTTLPAGDYLVAAVDRSHLAAWRDPEFLTAVARSAARVMLTWGGRTAQDVATVVVK